MLVAQSLVHLSEYQPKEGDICNLHADSKLKHTNKKSGDKKDDHLKGYDFTNEENVMAGKSEAELKDNSSNKKQDNVKGDFTNQENVSVTKDDSEEKKNETEKDNCKSVVQVKKPVPLKRQKYVKGKMTLKSHPFVKTKSNKMFKVKPKFKSSVKKEISEKRETNEPEAQSEENRMAFIHAEVEDIIKQGKGVEESSQRKQTLENILAMLGSTNGGEQKIEKGDIHKMDKPNTSNIVVSEVKEETVKLTVLVDDEDDDVNVEEEIKNKDCSDEFSSTDSSVKNIQKSISKLKDTDVGDSGAKAATKSVTFETSTCAQLDKSVEEEGAGEAADDTLSVDDLVIDLNHGQTVHSIVSDVVTEMVDTVVQQENKVIISGDPVDDCSDELSLTLPCLQMPRRDPYARQR